MEILPEDPNERRMFDDATRVLHDGDPLANVAQTLAIWSRTLPRHGSFSMALTVCANECIKAVNNQQGKDEL